MAVTIDLSGGANGTYTIEDDGIAGNGTSIVRAPDGTIFTTIVHPADGITILGRAAQNVVINFTDTLGTAGLTVGSLTNGAVRPDTILIGNVQTSGTVTLGANASIDEFGSDDGVDVTAGSLLMRAGAGIGTTGTIETQVAAVEAEAEIGGINFRNEGALQIGGITGDLAGLRTTTSGNILVASTGTITLADFSGLATIDSVGSVSLTANGSNSDITSSSAFDAINARGGTISLVAGRDVALGVGGTDFDNDVRAAGAISIVAGRDFTIDGFADMAANDFGTGSNGGVSISVGRDINVSDVHGIDASIGVTTGTGNLALTTGAGGTLTLTANSTSALFANGGNVIVNADRIVIDSGSGITTSGSGTVRLTTATTGREILLGSAADGTLALELSDAELDRINTTALLVGSGTSGQASVVGALSRTSGALMIQSGTNVSVGADVTITAGLTLWAAAGVTQDAGSTISAGSVSIVVDNPNVSSAGGVSAIAGSILSGSITYNGGSDGDTLGGSGANELFLLQDGGNDMVSGGGGNDRFYFGAAFTGTDRAIGGAGADSVILNGHYAGLVLGAASFDGIEIIRLMSASIGAFDYAITTHDANVAAGQLLTVNGGDLQAGESLTFNGSAETNGIFKVLGGLGNDIVAGGARGDEITGGGGNDALYGLAGNDRLNGGMGSDLLRGGYGNDVFVYSSAAESTSLDFDRLDRFEATADSIDLPGAVSGWTGNIAGGALSVSSFDADLAAAVNASLQAHSAVLFAPTSGDFAGRIFAVVDANGDGDYAAGADYVFEFVSPLTPPDSSALYFV